MDRHSTWCTIVCLIGGGQEINTGEAGLTEWLYALGHQFKDWDVYVSPKIDQKDYSWGMQIPEVLKKLKAHSEEALHLSISMRSFRAEEVSAFVGAVVDNDIVSARYHYQIIKERYPIKLTRDLNKARGWLRNKARGSERYGVLASSGGVRLKAEGLHVKSEIKASDWFLNGKEDIRSSYYLEDVATEFSVQGLEIDWACICWDADLRHSNGEWDFFEFRGTKWNNIKNNNNRIYLKNAYRVLLTRARQGMIIFIPKGDNSDHTRLSKFYDETFQFLEKCGLDII
jgi:DUF2075 family protein